MNDQQSHANQFTLLKQRRFAPFFWTQFLGAANDNLLKFAFTILVTYHVQVSWLPPSLAGLAVGALFIFPFLVFSATSGQLADKYDKATLIRFVKWLEIAIMIAAAGGFWLQNIPLLLACVLMMGLHSTLFGPVKYAYLPEHLEERELTGGNGMVEMGTFVAIRAAVAHDEWCAGHQLEPRHGDVAQPQARARQHCRFPVAARHFVDVVLWRSLPGAIPESRKGGAARRRAGGVVVARGVFAWDRYRVAPL